MRQATLDKEIKALKDNMEKQLTEEWKAAERIKIEAEVKAELMEWRKRSWLERSIYNTASEGLPVQFSHGRELPKKGVG